MTHTRLRSGPSPRYFVLARCCAEAQADGVPCPILGRDCDTCERATRDARDARDADDGERLPASRPVGHD